MYLWNKLAFCYSYNKQVKLRPEIGTFPSEFWRDVEATCDEGGPDIRWQLPTPNRTDNTWEQIRWNLIYQILGNFLNKSSGNICRKYVFVFAKGWKRLHRQG